MDVIPAQAPATSLPTMESSPSFLLKSFYNQMENINGMWKIKNSISMLCNRQKTTMQDSNKQNEVPLPCKVHKKRVELRYMELFVSPVII